MLGFSNELMEIMMCYVFLYFGLVFKFNKLHFFVKKLKADNTFQKLC